MFQGTAPHRIVVVGIAVVVAPPVVVPRGAALRTKNIAPWATTISLCYSGIMKLSMLAKPARVYRGVKEIDMELPPSFLENAQEGFAGGIELSFTSTTTSAEVAFKYSGRGRGSILVLDFNMSSRGASI